MTSSSHSEGAISRENANVVDSRHDPRARRFRTRALRALRIYGGQGHVIDLPYDEVAQYDGDPAIRSSAYCRSFDRDRETAGARGTYRVEIDPIGLQIR